MLFEDRQNDYFDFYLCGNKHVFLFTDKSKSGDMSLRFYDKERDLDIRPCPDEVVVEKLDGV